MKEQLTTKLLKLLALDRSNKYDILDLGCGAGQLLGEIQNVTGKGSNLIGIDSSEKAIGIAKNNFPTIQFRQDKFIDKLNFPDGIFDFVVSVDTLECIPDKNTLLKEIHRVLKKDGHLLFAHWDWDTQVYYSENKNIVRKFVAEFSDWRQDWMEASDGQMGRKMWGLFEHSELFKGNIDVFTLIETEYVEGKYGFDRLQDLDGLVKKRVLNESDYHIIRDEMKALYQKGAYFYSLNSYIYKGKKA